MADPICGPGRICLAENGASVPSLVPLVGPPQDLVDTSGGLGKKVRAVIANLSDGEVKKIRIGLEGYRFEVLTLPADNERALEFAREIDQIHLAPAEEEPPVAAVEEVPVPEGKSVLPWLLWPALGVGLAAAAAGGAFQANGNSANQSAAGADSFSNSRGYLDDAQTNYDRAKTLYIAGGAVAGAAAAGLVWYYFFRSDPQGSVSLNVAPNGVMLNIPIDTAE